MRKAFLAFLLAIFVPGCDSPTEPLAERMPIVFFDSPLDGGLVLLTADGKFRQEVLDMPDGLALFPRWSPNGRQIAFYRIPWDPYGSVYGLFIMNADGSGLQRIPTPPDGLSEADWSPDGTRLVAYSGSRLVTFKPDGTDLVFLPPTNVDTYEFRRGISWSRDGNEILYVGRHAYDGRSTGPDIWIFNIATGVSRMLATPAIDARWSPDGHQVAYIETGGAGGPGRLAVINSDGSNKRILTANSQAKPQMTWSPDGRRLLFVLGGGDQTNLYTISVDGGEARPLTNVPGNFAHYPDWYWGR
jgi:Tol biopolymer transport system component